MLLGLLREGFLGEKTPPYIYAARDGDTIRLRALEVSGRFPEEGWHGASRLSSTAWPIDGQDLFAVLLRRCRLPLRYPPADWRDAARTLREACLEKGQHL